MAKANPISVQKYLKGVDYPATTEELIQHAQKQVLMRKCFQSWSNYLKMKNLKAQPISAKL